MGLNELFLISGQNVAQTLRDPVFFLASHVGNSDLKVRLEVRGQIGNEATHVTHLKAGLLNALSPVINCGLPPWVIARPFK